MFDSSPPERDKGMGRTPYVRMGTRSVGPRARQIAAEIAAQYGLDLSDMTGRARARSVAWPRQHVMAALRLEGYSESQIGLLLNRDASTVSYGYWRHLERTGEGA